MATGTIVTITPTGDITRTHIERKEGGLPIDDIRAALGGYAEQIGVVFEQKKRTAFIDEDAKIKSRDRPPVNAFATRMVQEYYPEGGRTVDILGNIVVWIPDEKPSRKETLKPRNLIEDSNVS